MAKPNYQHMKKQRELARKKHQEEKRSRKQTRTEPAVAEPTEPKSTP